MHSLSSRDRDRHVIKGDAAASPESATGVGYGGGARRATFAHMPRSQAQIVLAQLLKGVSGGGINIHNEGEERLK